MNAFNPELSNGAMMDLGVYTVYPLVVLFGRPKRISATGLKLSTGVDGQGAVNFEYENLNATVLYSKIADSFLPAEIQGEKGTFILDRIQTIREVKFIPKGGQIQDLSVPASHNEYYYEIAEFIDLIERRLCESTINSHDHSLATLEIIDEVRKHIRDHLSCRQITIMNKAKVYFTNLRTTPNSNLLDKMERLVRKAGIADISFEQQFTAIKIHFGEPGNLAYIRPNYAARLVQVLRSLGAKPFLTDCNTLYSGHRANAVDHLQSAMENGFNPISAQCQVIIADGLKGTEYREIEIGGEYCQARRKSVAAIADADIIVSMTHFKGHEHGRIRRYALKNLGMGCCQRRWETGTALLLPNPLSTSQNCTGMRHLRQDIAPTEPSIAHRTTILPLSTMPVCVGCGQCVALCQFDAAQ